MPERVKRGEIENTLEHGNVYTCYNCLMGLCVSVKVGSTPPSQCLCKKDLLHDKKPKWTKQGKGLLRIK